MTDTDTKTRRAAYHAARVVHEARADALNDGLHVFLQVIDGGGTRDEAVQAVQSLIREEDARHLNLRISVSQREPK